MNISIYGVQTKTIVLVVKTGKKAKINVILVAHKQTRVTCENIRVQRRQKYLNS